MFIGRIIFFGLHLDLHYGIPSRIGCYYFPNIVRAFAIGRYYITFAKFFCLVPGIPSTRLNGGVLLGPLPIGTSASLVSTPNLHLRASSECY